MLQLAQLGLSTKFTGPYPLIPVSTILSPQSHTEGILFKSAIVRPSFCQHRRLQSYLHNQCKEFHETKAHCLCSLKISVTLHLI